MARPAPLTRTGKVLLATDLIDLAIILGIVLYERNEFGDMATLGILIFLASLPSFLIGLTLFRFRLFNKPSRFIASPKYLADITKLPPERRSYWINRHFDDDLYGVAHWNLFFGWLFLMRLTGGARLIEAAYAFAYWLIVLVLPAILLRLHRSRSKKQFKKEVGLQ